MSVSKRKQTAPAKKAAAERKKASPTKKPVVASRRKVAKSVQPTTERTIFITWPEILFLNDFRCWIQMKGHAFALLKRTARLILKMRFKEARAAFLTFREARRVAKTHRKEAMRKLQYLIVHYAR